MPQSCEADVIALLTEVRNRVSGPGDHDEAAFDAVQNAEVAANAEHYYRIMVRGDRRSWNVRDHHMADTIDRLSRHLGRHPRASSGSTTPTWGMPGPPTWPRTDSSTWGSCCASGTPRKA